MSTWIKPRSSKFEHYLVDVTPTPVFTRLEGLDNWVVRRVEVLGGVLVLGRIAAANMPAFETEAQVYPRVSDFQTILTTICAGCDWSYLVKMCALCSQDSFLSARFNLRSIKRDSLNIPKTVSTTLGTLRIAIEFHETVKSI
jgi:hypothetical protein